VPFCTNCGAQVGGADAFCHNCGLPQGSHPGSQQGSQTAGASRPPGTGPGPVPGYAAPTTDFLHGMSERTASVLCYIPVFGIIPAIIFLASQKFRRNARVRFDAFQSLYLFVAWLILHAVVPVVFMGFGPAESAMALLLKLGMIGLWVVLLIRASRDEPTHIPVLGELAARSAAEQS
jgi:uncharacterized membrane protein